MKPAEGKKVVVRRISDGAQLVLPRTRECGWCGEALDDRGRCSAACEPSRRARVERRG